MTNVKFKLLASAIRQKSDGYLEPLIVCIACPIVLCMIMSSALGEAPYPWYLARDLPTKAIFLRTKRYDDGSAPKYDFMRRRTKKFPWGDGDKSFFHNDRVNK